MAAGDPVYSSTVVSSKDSNITDGTTTSTTFTNSLTTTGIRGVTFVAPASGKVRVMGGSSGRVTTGTTNFSIVDFEIRTGNTIGSGTIFRASDINSASTYQSAVANAGGQHFVLDVVTGLTPGAVYNASLTFEVTAGTGAFNRRKITVESVL